MKLKFYLRGLGVGLIVGALLTGVFYSGGGELSDEEIKERAARLGMIEDTVLTSGLSEEENSVTEQQENNSAESSLEDSSEEDTVSEPTESDINDLTENEDSLITEEQQTLPANATDSDDVITVTGNDEEIIDASGKDEGNTNSTGQTDENNIVETEDGEAYVITDRTVAIPGGSGSDTVAQILEDAGLIDSASSFNRYLIDRGLDRKIRSGTFHIPEGVDYEGVAKAITGG